MGGMSRHCGGLGGRGGGVGGAFQWQRDNAVCSPQGLIHMKRFATGRRDAWVFRC